MLKPYLIYLSKHLTKQTSTNAKFEQGSLILQGLSSSWSNGINDSKMVANFQEYSKKFMGIYTKKEQM